MSGVNGPDNSIVSVPCPSTTSECPTPASIRSSLRRRHSDLNLSSIANFLRTRFSRQDDTVDPSKNGDEVDELLKQPFGSRNSIHRIGLERNSENQNIQTPSSKPHNGIVRYHSTSAVNSSRCQYSTCSNNSNAVGSSAYRRPCIRCKQHLIEAIMESDATEV